MILVLFVKNKWALMGIMTPLGIAFAIFNSIPFAICGMIVGSEQMGTFMSVLNCFAFFGQQLSLSLVGAGKGFFLRATAPIIGAGSGFSHRKLSCPSASTSQSPAGSWQSSRSFRLL